MRNFKVALIAGALLALAGCAGSTGVFPVSPGVWSVSEMRAPVLGGGEAAKAAVVAEANGFCQSYGLVLVPISMGPSAPPNSAYGPVSYSAAFSCAPPSPPAKQ